MHWCQYLFTKNVFLKFFLLCADQNTVIFIAFHTRKTQVIISCSILRDHNIDTKIALYLIPDWVLRTVVLVWTLPFWLFRKITWSLSGQSLDCRVDCMDFAMMGPSDGLILCFFSGVFPREPCTSSTVHDLPPWSPWCDSERNSCLLLLAADFDTTF